MKRLLTISSLLMLTLSSIVAGCMSGQDKGANGAPVAVIKIVPGGDGHHFILDGSGSHDPDGDPLTYAWNWQLGTSSEKSLEVEFDPAIRSANLYVSLVVRDDSGAVADTLQTLKLGNGTNKAPKVKAAEANRWVVPGALVDLDGRLSSDPDGDPLLYEWIWGPRGSYDPTAAAPGDGSASKSPATFSTGYLSEGQSYQVKFDQQGTYDFHCHPHPWMTGRIQVDPALAASSNVTVEIRNFGFGNTTRVGPGTTVTFRNADASAHTATMEFFTPGVQSGGTSSLFQQELAEGEYVARLIARDGKGGRGSATWGLKASMDAPESPRILQFAATENAVLLSGVSGSSSTTTPAFNASFPHILEAVLDWEDNSPAPGRANFSLEQVTAQGTDPAPVTQCVAEYISFEKQQKIHCMIEGLVNDKYRFKVVAEDGAVRGWTIEGQAFPFASPGFGDASGEGDNHPHHH